MTNIHNAKVSDSTLDDVIVEGANEGRRVLRRITIALVAAIVFAALLGAFDSESSTSKSKAGLTVDAHYPVTARAGNEVELEVRVSSEKQLPETFKITLNDEYLLFFEDLAVFPDPEAQSSDGSGAVEFELASQQDATQMVVRIMGRASDRWELRTRGELSVRIEETTINVPITTWRVP